MALARGPRDLVCSARGCESPASVGIVWANPALHTGRHKTWLACEEHRAYLLDYLRLRSFPAGAVPLDRLDDPSGGGPSASRPH